jgi:hypothetical protein
VGIRIDVFDVWAMSLSSNWLIRSIASGASMNSAYHDGVVRP